MVDDSLSRVEVCEACGAEVVVDYLHGRLVDLVCCEAVNGDLMQGGCDMRAVRTSVECIV